MSPFKVRHESQTKVICTTMSNNDEGDEYSLDSFHSSACPSESEPPNFEDMLKQIGTFSRMQIMIFVILYAADIPAAWMTFIPLFIGTVPEWWKCIEFTNLSKLNISSNASSSEEELFTQYYTNVKNICYCSGKYAAADAAATIVSNWNWVCELDWVGDLTTSLQMVGVLLGTLIISPAADWFGRKKIFYSAFAFVVFAGMTSALVSSHITFIVSRFAVGMGVGGITVLINLYPMEFISASERHYCSAVGAWPIGIITLSGMSYLIKDWRHLLLLTSLPWVIYLTTSIFIPESPRWLLKQGRVSDAHEVLSRIARTNGRPPPKICQVNALCKSIQRESAEAEGHKYTFVDLFSSWKLAKSTFIFSYSWFVCCTVYYGVPLSTANFSGETHRNMLYLGVVDIIAHLSVIPVSKRFGRRYTLIAYSTCGAFFLLMTMVFDLATIPVKFPHLSLEVAMAIAARFGLTGAWISLTIFTAETSPTAIRALGVGLPAAFGRIGSALAPQVVYLGSKNGRAVPHVVFIVLTLTMAIASWFVEDISSLPLKENLPRRNWTLCGCFKKKRTSWGQTQVSVIELPRNSSVSA